MLINVWRDLMWSWSPWKKEVRSRRILFESNCRTWYYAEWYPVHPSFACELYCWAAHWILVFPNCCRSSRVWCRSVRYRISDRHCIVICHRNSVSVRNRVARTTEYTIAALTFGQLCAIALSNSSRTIFWFRLLCQASFLFLVKGQ